MKSIFISLCLLALINPKVFLNAQELRASLDRQLCARQFARCQETIPRLGTSDDAVVALNEQCIIIRGPSWKNVTRCQLSKVNCELALKCRKFTCKNVEKVLQ